MSNRAPSSRRRFWQFYLSTAVLLMFAAGGAIWVNALPHVKHPCPEMPQDWYVYHYGWPTVVYSDAEPFWRHKISMPISALVQLGREIGAVGWIPANLAMNFGVAACILVVMGCVIEWLIRHREGERP